jgi:hypothetical protein
MALFTEETKPGTAEVRKLSTDTESDIGPPG